MHLSGYLKSSLFYMVLPLAALRAAEVIRVGRRAWHQGSQVQFWAPDPAYRSRAYQPPTY